MSFSSRDEKISTATKGLVAASITFANWVAPGNRISKNASHKADEFHSTVYWTRSSLVEMALNSSAVIRESKANADLTTDRPACDKAV